MRSTAVSKSAKVFDDWLQDQPRDVRDVVMSHLFALQDSRKGMGRMMAKELLLQIYLTVAEKLRGEDVAM